MNANNHPHPIPVNPNQLVRERAVRRLNQVTTGAAIAGVAAVLGFGTLAAATNASSTASVAPTAVATISGPSTTGTSSGSSTTSTSSGTTTTRRRPPGHERPAGRRRQRPRHDGRLVMAGMLAGASAAPPRRA